MIILEPCLDPANTIYLLALDGYMRAIESTYKQVESS